MATIIQREAVVGPNGRIEIIVPEFAPGQRVIVSIAVQETLAKRPSAIEILNASPGRRLFKTAEEVDEYIRQERDSWEREPGDPRG